MGVVLLHPHMVTAPGLDHCLSCPVPSGHMGTLRSREVRASQRRRWERTCEFSHPARDFI